MAATDLKLSFDGKDPAAFYLGALQHELEATANVCLVVEGTRLPVHSHVLQCNSRVLCAMFADLTAQAGMCGQLGSGGSRKRKRADQQVRGHRGASRQHPHPSALPTGPLCLVVCMPPATATTRHLMPLLTHASPPWQGGQLVLEEPLRGFSLHDVALFLRLVYNQEWREGVAATLGALHDSLPALLRLAHRLDAPGLQGTLTKYMAGLRLGGTGNGWPVATLLPALVRVQQPCPSWPAASRALPRIQSPCSPPLPSCSPFTALLQAPP